MEPVSIPPPNNLSNSILPVDIIVSFFLFSKNIVLGWNPKEQILLAIFE
jgi:hypothetical protein